jgi:hypothetical protein
MFSPHCGAPSTICATWTSVRVCGGGGQNDLQSNNSSWLERFGQSKAYQPMCECFNQSAIFRHHILGICLRRVSGDNFIVITIAPSKMKAPSQHLFFASIVISSAHRPQRTSCCARRRSPRNSTRWRAAAMIMRLYPLSHSSHDRSHQ